MTQLTDRLTERRGATEASRWPLWVHLSGCFPLFCFFSLSGKENCGCVTLDVRCIGSCCRHTSCWLNGENAGCSRWFQLHPKSVTLGLDFSIFHNQKSIFASFKATLNRAREMFPQRRTLVFYLENDLLPNLKDIHCQKRFCFLLI